MKKTILYIVIYLFVIGFVHAQIPADVGNSGFVENLDEQVHFYTDRDLYLSGEEVWFTAYVVINGYFNKLELSKVAYIECYDAEKKKIFKGKFEIRNSIASGSFQVPLETLSGNYFIRAYTQYQRNFLPESFSTKIISIINPEFPLPKQEQAADTIKTGFGESDTTKQDINDAFKISVQTDKTSFGKREAVELKIKIPDMQMAGLCVSVIRQGTLRQAEGNIGLISDESIKERSKDVFWLPETRGLNISGVVSEKNSQQTLGNINVYLSVMGKNPQFHITQTKENGEFIFTLGEITFTNEIFIGVKPQEDKDFQLFVNNGFSNEFTHLLNIPLSIDTTHKSLIEEMLVNYQSQKIFKPTEAEATKTVNQSIGEPDVSVLLADFIDLVDMETVFFEIVPTVFIKNKNDRKSLHVSNPATEWVFENELLLLDYVPVFDLDVILEIPPERIKQIDVINNTWYLGDNTLRNAVMINSKGRDFAGYEFPNGSIFIDYQTLTPEKTFNIPSYDSSTEKTSRIPDFRTLLYWNPELKIAKGDTTLIFYTSDNTGEYDIIVRGITKNGERCIGKASINIQ
jgi:hypothetical protein